MTRKTSGEWWASAMVCRTLLLIPLVLLSSVLGSGSPSFSEFRFTVQPIDTVTEKDRPLALPCAAHHEGEEPEIQWIRDDVYMTPDNRRQILANGSFYFNQVEHSRSHRPDEGIYQCVATVPSLGTIISRKAKLQIAYINKNFDAEPQSLSVHLGDTAMFACDMGGAPKPNVRWYKDEIAIDTQNVNFHIHRDGVLEISSVQFSDFGRYKCEAENVHRSRMSVVAELTQDSNAETYQGVPPHFVMEPKETVAVEGEIVILYCGANGRDRQGQTPTITWLKDGVTIDMSNLDSRFSVEGQGSLRIDSVNEGDSGAYTCRSTNMEDSEDSDITLNIQVPPKFRKRPKSVFAQIHTSVEFECDIYGVPKPNIRWLKDGDQIIPSDYFQIVDGQNLRILGLVNSDHGMYQCMAENSVGNVQASAQLLILQQGSHQAASHTLPSRPEELTAAYVSTRFITLAWRQPTNPGTSDIESYSVFWKEVDSNRERVLNTTAMEANIQHLKPSTSYEFRVIAFNGAGASPEAAQINVQTEQEIHVPGPPQELSAVPQSPTSISVSWQPPATPHGDITKYEVLYYQVGNSDGDVKLTTNDLEETITGLAKFTQYSFRVVGYNNNGAGTSTDEVLATSLSDVPDQPPQNVTVETDSSTSLIVSWEPPPEESQNGLITGYKVRYKVRGARRGETVTTDGNRRSYELSELGKGTEYNIRVQALTVNGSGPATDWLNAETYSTDLEENTVPGQPTSLRVRPMTDSIVVSWTPPQEQDIMIRGYILGYGIGIPDTYRQVLSSKQRSHIIKMLKPSTNYVLTLRAFNNRGEGQMRLESTYTREETTPEPMTPMIPPVGLKAIVLSSTTIVLTWSDTSLGRNQRINDPRYYTIRYFSQARKGRNKYLNATDLNIHIDDLKPNTGYEFSVKVTKGRRKSTWSLSVFNRTFEDAPSTAPRDLTPVAVEGKPNWVTLNWQPPRQPNGQVTGYLVYYTTDPTQPDRDWVVEGVMGEKLSETIRDLTSDTTYFFKVQARNSKGYGPMSPTVIFRTPKEDGTGGGMIETPFDGEPGSYPNRNRGRDPYENYWEYDKTTPNRKDDKSGGEGVPALVLWVSIGAVGAITLIAVLVVTIILCKRRNGNTRKGGYQPANKKPTPVKPGPKDLKPPDLWIHDNMELKKLENSNSDSQDAKSMDESGMGMDKRRSSFLTERDRLEEERYHRTPYRAKPIMIPVDQPPPPREPIATAIPNGHLPTSDRDGPPPIRPVYPRTQYANQYSSTPRVNAGDLSAPSSEDHNSSYSSSTLERRKKGDKIRKQSGSNPRLTGPVSPESPVYNNIPPGIPPIPYEQLQLEGAISPTPSSPGGHTPASDGSRSLTRPLHPLKSFSVPGPPPQNSAAPHAPVPKHIVRPQQQQQQQQPTSPYKKPSAPPVTSPVPDKSRSPLPVVSPRAPDVTINSNPDESELPKSFSTEELTAEMANLEGLMKDLNAITQQEFEC